MAEMEWWHFVIAAVWLVLFRLRRRRTIAGGQTTGASRDLLGRGGF